MNKSIHVPADKFINVLLSQGYTPNIVNSHKMFSLRKIVNRWTYAGGINKHSSNYEYWQHHTCVRIIRYLY